MYDWAKKKKKNEKQTNNKQTKIPEQTVFPFVPDRLRGKKEKEQVHNI